MQDKHEETSYERADATDTPGSASAMIERLRKRFFIGLAFGLVVVMAIVIISDGPALARTLEDFQWWLLPLIILFTLVNYALRFVKWEFYLGLLDVHSLRRSTSLFIFLAGLAMAITPGKIGELLKSYLVRRATGTPMSITAPIPIGERVTDGLAMLILASIGLLTFQYGWQLLLVVGLFAIVGVGAIQSRRLVHWCLGKAERFPIISSRMHVLHRLYDSTYILLKDRNLLIAVGIGLVSWAGECMAFYLILIGLGMPMNFEFLMLAVFVLATATILGSISMLPGGLGAAEASVAGLLLVLVDNPSMTSDVARAATLLIRFATLWLGVILGVVALVYVDRHLNTVASTARATVPVQHQTGADG